MQHVLFGFLLVNILCSIQLITLDGMMDHLKWVNVILGDILLLIDKLAGSNQLKIFDEWFWWNILVTFSWQILITFSWDILVTFWWDIYLGESDYCHHPDHLCADNDDISNNSFVDSSSLLLIPSLDEVCPTHLDSITVSIFVVILVDFDKSMPTMAMPQTTTAMPVQRNHSSRFFRKTTESKPTKIMIEPWTQEVSLLWMTNF